MVEHYMGRVRDIIKIDASFNGDATLDATIDVISQTKIDCSSENIAETVSDGIRSDGKCPTKHTINARSQVGRSSKRRRNHWTAKCRLQS